MAIVGNNLTLFFISVLGPQLGHHRDSLELEREMYTKQSLRTGRLVEDTALRTGRLVEDTEGNNWE